MAFEFKMPDIGEGLVEGEIVKWLVAAGDTVVEDQPMVEVLTDKATVELPAPRAGVIRELKAKAGDVVPVGTVIVTIDEAAGTAAPPAAAPPAAAPPAAAPPAAAPPAAAPPAAAPPAAAPPAAAPPAAAPPAAAPPAAAPPAAKPAAAAPPPPPATVPAPASARVLATPAVRRYAREQGVDLAAVPGSGPGGRMTREDVDSFRAAPPAPVVAAPPVAPAPPAPVPVASAAGDTRVPVRGLRRLIGQSMSRSKRTAAHFTIIEEALVDELVALKEVLQHDIDAAGARITYLPIIMKACVPVLREFPYLNASMDDSAQEIVLKAAVNIGLATDTEQGLVVPVVKDVPGKTIPEIARELADLSARARAGKSTPDDLKGGTFTITSTGPQGGLFATPVINHPEVAILGVHAIRKKPVVRGDQVAIGNVMHLSLSIDHRVADGMTGARFLERLVEILEHPGRLLLGMR